MSRSIAVLILAVFTAAVAPAHLVMAAPLNLSTGLDASDTLITIGNTPDAHWTVDQPLGGTAPAEVVAAGNTGGAFPSWAANGSNSSWITIDADSFGNAPVIPYSYYRTFTLTPAEVALASISGTWGIDDGGDLRLNGNLLSSLPNDYSASTPFTAAAGSGFFVAGVNTLTITMTTSDNFYEAVRLEGALTVPEPGTLMLGAFGALGLLFAARRPR